MENPNQVSSTELWRKIENFSNRLEEVERILKEIEIARATESVYFNQINLLTPKIAEMEKEVHNSRVIVNAVKWLAFTAGASVVSLAVSALLQKGG